MDAEDILTPTILFSDRLIRSAFTGRGRNRHRFGGPLEHSIVGWPRRQPAPRLVLTLNLVDAALRLRDVSESGLPLVYGFQTDGCRLRYRAERGKLKLLDFKGRKLKDWPYRDYPPMFPTVPMYFRRSERIDWKRLERNEDWHGITWQDSRPKVGEMVVVVPGSDAYGVSLWGRYGDYVQTVFRIDLKTLEIEAWNECD